MISGAFFPPHAIERTLERTPLTDFDHDLYEQKFIDLDGTLYWDKKHENYQIVFEHVIFAFHLKLHDTRPGLLAFVHTALNEDNGQRPTHSRFIHLPTNIETECICCGPTVDPDNVADQLKDLENADAETHTTR